MRIAQIAPLVFSVPPKRFGGTERIVSYLTEELVEQGHDVVLFASGDSQTRAELVACSPEPISPFDWQRRVAHHILMYERAYGQADRFDVVHNHTHLYGAALARRSRTPTVTTMHGALQRENVWEARMFAEYHELPLVAISRSQRAPFPELSWLDTIYHGLPEELYSLHERPGSYLAFLGRVDPSKGIGDAVEIARRADMPLKIAGFTGFVPPAYLEQLKALFAHPLVEYVGEVSDAEKDEFLGNAAALLFPIQWEEPFGIVLIEALACGTPVIGYGRGAVPEIIADGESGYLVGDVAGAAAAVGKLGELSRARCRAIFDERFTARRMARDYVACYQRLIQ